MMTLKLQVVFIDPMRKILAEKRGTNASRKALRN